MHRVISPVSHLMKTISAILLFLLCCTQVIAQSDDFMLLKRGAKQKTQIRFYPGEKITYKSDKLNYFVTDVIKQIDDDFIYLGENILAPHNILEIDIRNKDSRNGTLRNLNAITLGAGILLLGVESINSIYQTGQFSIDRGVGITSGILIGTGIALLPIRYKVFKNSGRNSIQLIRKQVD